MVRLGGSLLGAPLSNIDEARTVNYYCEVRLRNLRLRTTKTKIMREEILKMLLESTETVNIASGDNSETAVAIKFSEWVSNEEDRKECLINLANEIADKLSLK